jgi:hypothetical protein
MCKAGNLPLSSADVMESGSLNLPEPSGAHRPVMGLFYLFYTMLEAVIAVCTFIQTEFEDEYI